MSYRSIWSQYQGMLFGREIDYDELIKLYHPTTEEKARSIRVHGFVNEDLLFDFRTGSGALISDFTPGVWFYAADAEEHDEEDLISYLLLKFNTDFLVEIELPKFALLDESDPESLLVNVELFPIFNIDPFDDGAYFVPAEWANRYLRKAVFHDLKHLRQMGWQR